MVWTCDYCGGEIESVEDGWVEWLSSRNGEKTEKGLRLVHHNRNCMYNEQIVGQDGYGVRDNHLEYFIEDDGLIRLLELILINDFEDNNEIVEMITRLHVKNYEEVHTFIEPAIRENIISPREFPISLYQSDINAIIDWKNNAPS